MADLIAAFADTPILLPLVFLLSSQAGYSASLLLVSAGILSIFSGVFFRCPISIQPLKSVVITALALGASGLEIRMAGLALGVFFILLLGLKVNRLSIPESVVRTLQGGLGVLLIQQSFKAVHLEWESLGLWITLVLGVLYFHYQKNLRLLGWLAFGVFTSSLLRAQTPVAVHPEAEMLRPWIIISLLIPQLALTSANSITGAELALHHYFGETSKRATPKRLMASIGFGNLLMALIGGLPFCHGAGGITAHAQSGARSARMNFYWGAILILFGLTIFAFSLNPKLPEPWTSAVLFLNGFFHLALARPLLKGTPTVSQSVRVIGAMTLLLLTGNLFYVFLFSMITEFSFQRFSHA